MREQGGLTVWDREDKVIESQWGKVSYAKWCVCEAARLRTVGGAARVIRRMGQRDGREIHECCVEERLWAGG